VRTSKGQAASEHLGGMRPQHRADEAVERFELGLQAQPFGNLASVIAQGVGGTSATQRDELFESPLDFCAR